MTTNTSTHRLGTRMAIALAATFLAGSVLLAHDFWLVPNGLTFAPGSSLEVLGQSGTKFPTSDGATQPSQVAEARIVSASGDERITDLSVTGKSLVLKHAPAKAGQNIVAVALTSRTARTTPERLKRYLAIEGAPELAERYDHEGAFPKMDSVTQVSAKYAKMVVEIGTSGPRAFDKVLGHSLEIVPLQDPARLRVGDTLSVRLLFHGKAVGNVHLRAGSAPAGAIMADSASRATMTARPDQSIVTASNGVAKLSIGEPGLWNVRVLYAAAMTGMPEHWEAYFATMVFSVNDARMR